MRYEELQGKKVTVVFGGGVPALTGTVGGGDGDTIYLDVMRADLTTQRHRLNEGQIVYIKEEQA